MLGALFLVHAAAGVFADKGGYELVLLLGAAALAVALAGAGRISVDRALFGRRNTNWQSSPKHPSIPPHSPQPSRPDDRTVSP